MEAALGEAPTSGAVEAEQSSADRDGDEDDPEAHPPDQGTLWMDVPPTWEKPPTEPRREPMQVPEARARITVESRPHHEEETVIEDQGHAREPEPRTIGEAADVTGERIAELLEERPTQRGDTEQRVAYLFPRPETTEWDVRELSYDRRRRAQIRAS